MSADYDPFFADAAELQAEAIAICATCPVDDACLTFAVRTGQQYGIWGGQPQMWHDRDRYPEHNLVGMYPLGPAGGADR